MRQITKLMYIGILSGATSFAQVPTVRSGSFELGGFVGATYGIGAYGAMGGGNLSYAASKWILPYVEYSYFPSIERQLSGTIAGTGGAFKADYTIRANDFHGGVHLRVPIKESRFVPYGVFGLGSMGYSSATLNVSFTDSTGTHTIPGGVQSPGGQRFTINFGGGVRYYTSPRYGFRVEVKGYKPFGEPSGAQLGYSNPFLKVEGGFFIQFH